MVWCKYFVFWSTVICSDWNGMWLLQYSISKHGGWLIAFFGWNWAMTNDVGCIFKEAWHFLNVCACKKYIFRNSDKIRVPLIRAKLQKINQIQAHSWYSSWLYDYRWNANWYTIRIYRLSASICALQYHRHGQKVAFLICGPWFATTISI